MKVIKVKCRAADLVSPHALNVIQGDLKSLSKINYKRLKGKIEKHGFSFAIHVWKDEKGELNVLDGTQRLRVILHEEAEGNWSVPLVPINYVDADSFKDAVDKLLGAASSYGEAEKDGLYELMHLAGLGIEDIQDVSFPGIGLKAFEYEFFLEGEEPDDEVREYTAERTTEGTLWQCGEHRILCGDATQGSVWERVLEGESAELINIDPPYGAHELLIEAVRLSIEHGAKDYACFGWGSDADIFALARAYPTDLKRLFVYPFAEGLGGQGAYIFHSNVGVLFNTHKRFNNLSDAFGSVLKAVETRSKRKDTFSTGQVKPVALFQDLYAHYSVKGGLVLDPFSGFGTTLLACEYLNRRARCIELDPNRVEASVRRWERYSGKVAELLGAKGSKVRVKKKGEAIGMEGKVDPR